MKLHCLITLYFCLNCFSAGQYYQSSFNWRDSLPISMLTIMCHILFATPIYMILMWISLFGYIYHELDKIFQVSFYLYYVFTKKFDNLPIDKLRDIWQINKKHNTNSLKDRIYRHGAALLFKRNNKYKGE